MPKQEKKIETPQDIYDFLFNDILRNEMEYFREHGFHGEAERTLRIIEFLEKHLFRGQE